MANVVPKGQIKENFKFVIDSYGNKIYVGAKVAFYYKSKLYFGQVVSLTIYSVTDYNTLQDSITFKVFIEEEKTKQEYELRSLDNIACL